MTTLAKRMWVGALQIALVTSVGGKLLADRATYPRVWVQAAPIDPSSPIRGRYVSLRLEVTPGPHLDLPAPRTVTTPAGNTFRPGPPQPVRLHVEAEHLLADPGDPGATDLLARRHHDGNHQTVELVEPVAFYIPPTVADPSRRAAGETLWVEVTVPPVGPPRPIRLGVSRGGAIEPLNLR